MTIEVSYAQLSKARTPSIAVTASYSSGGVLSDEISPRSMDLEISVAKSQPGRTCDDLRLRESP